MKNKAPRKKPAVNRVYYIYVGILAVLFFTFHLWGQRESIRLCS